LLPALRTAARAHDPGMPLSEVRTLERIVDDAVSGTRFTTLLLALFATIALTLATVGTYGVIAYGVSQRRHDDGHPHGDRREPRRRRAPGADGWRKRRPDRNHPRGRGCARPQPDHERPRLRRYDAGSAHVPRGSA